MTTALRPTDLPELRAELIDWLHGPTAASLWRNAIKREIYNWMLTEGTLEPEEGSSLMRGAEILKLEAAELFHVSPPMVDLARVAGKTLPPFNLAREDVPSRSGLMLFGESAGTLDINGASVGVRAMSWGPHPAGRRRELFVSLYFDRDDIGPVIARHATYRDYRAEPRLIYGHGSEFFWTYGTDLKRGEHDAHLVELAQTIRSTWLLMQQTLARSTEAMPDRHARRRLERAGREPSRVRVIELRRSDNAPGSGLTDREYHHQWVVRGHWRQQACGAGRAERRPTWIAPHIKGPDGAPVLGGEKVYAWKR